MLLRHLFNTTDITENQVWARSGKKIVRKYKCSSGPRQGRVVAKIAQCFAAPDIKKKQTLKRTHARLGARITRKAKKTKRTNPTSRRLQSMNKKSRKR